MGYSMILPVLVLLSCFVLVSNKNVKAYIRTFRIQSILIAIIAGIAGFERLDKGDGLEILFVCLIIIILKVFYIPRILIKTFSNLKLTVEKDYFYNIPSLEFISLLIVVFCYFTIPTMEVMEDGKINSYLVNSISVILIGFLFMISRKKAIGQIIGFLVIENGLFITTLYSTHGMPIVIDMGIFVELITAVLIMGMMVFNIHKNFDTINTNKLKNLRG